MNGTWLLALVTAWLIAILTFCTLDYLDVIAFDRPTKTVTVICTKEPGGTTTCISQPVEVKGR